jgi:hypothetical protein
MLAADGAFDEAIETVTATIDTSTLALGCHLFLVEGKDNNGQVGVPSAVGFEVRPEIPIAPTPQPNQGSGGCWQKQWLFMPLVAGE